MHLLSDKELLHQFCLLVCLAVVLSSGTVSTDLEHYLQVMLSDDYAQYGDADEGPLKPGDIGTLLEDDGSSTPYNVQTASGDTWWYKKKAIVKFKVHFQT